LAYLNGIVAKTAISSAYPHVSLKILDEFPNAMGSGVTTGPGKAEVGNSTFGNPFLNTGKTPRIFRLGRQSKSA
jgi:hypothetical protein